MFQPSWVSPPGATLVRSIKAQGLSRQDACDSLSMTEVQLDRLFQGGVRIDSDLAARLEELTGKSRIFWEKREQQYRRDLEHGWDQCQTLGIDADDWLRSIPVSQMIKFGWISCRKSKENKIAEALQFFGVSSIPEWNERYSAELSAYAFRTSKSFDNEKAVTAAWLRMAEIQASQIECSPWNKVELEKNLPIIRSLSVRKGPRAFFKELVQICASCGVSVVHVPNLKGTRAYGATRFLTPNKAMIVLSNRYKSDDHFWFTFFHEVGHLILHDKMALFVENGDAISTIEEQEANQFAERILIPGEALQSLFDQRITGRAVARLAFKIGVSRGVIVGQLQHKKIIANKSLNYLKKRYLDDDFLI